jgi:lipoate-protein ligase A
MLRLIRDLAPSFPADGLALEETLFEAAFSCEKETLRFWVNDRAVIVGRSQSVKAEVDKKQATKLGIPILRRLSGGGTVYHYPGNLNVSLYLSDSRFLGGVKETFSLLGEAIASSLADLKIGILVRKNNLFIDEKKLAGAAQARRGKSLLYHTTLLVKPANVPMETLLLALRKGYHPLRVPSTPHQTTTIAEASRQVLPLEDLVQRIAAGLSQFLKHSLHEGGLTKKETRRARELAAKKYRSDRWNMCH